MQRTQTLPGIADADPRLAVAAGWRWCLDERRRGNGVGRREPIVIAHRGASGYRPEHTLAAYQLAIEHGRRLHRARPRLDEGRRARRPPRERDRRHDRRRVASGVRGRRTTKTIDGAPVTGWFTEDFTLAELKTLRAKERLPPLRPANTRFDGLYEVPTLQEVIDLAEARDGGRHLPGDEAPVVLRLDRPLARGAARARRSTRTADRKQAPGLHPVVRGREPEGADPDDRRAARAAHRRHAASPTTSSSPATRGPTPTSPRRPGLREIATYARRRRREQEPDRAARRRGPAAAADVVRPRRPPRGPVVHAWTFRRENRSCRPTTGRATRRARSTSPRRATSRPSSSSSSSSASTASSATTADTRRRRARADLRATERNGLGGRTSGARIVLVAIRAAVVLELLLDQ